MYDPVLDRFTGRDPFGGKFKEPLTLHKYLYCNNDPINKTDPSGLFWGGLWEFIKGIIGAVGDAGGTVGGGQAMLEGGSSVMAYQVALMALCEDTDFIYTPEYEKLREIAMRTKEENTTEQEDTY